MASGFEVFKRELFAGFSDGAEILLSEFAEAPGEAEATGLTIGEALSRGIASGVAGIRGPGGIGDIIALWAQDDVVSDSMTSEMREVRDAFEGGALGAELYGEAAFDATGPTVDLAAEVEALGDRVKPIGSDFEQAAVGAKSFRDSLQQNEFGAMLDTALATTQGFMDLKQTLVDLDESVDISDIADGIASLAEDTIAVLEEVLAIADPLQERIASIFEFQGANAAVAEADKIRDGLIRTFEAAGLGTEQITELLDVMNLAEGDIDVAVKVSGTDVAIAQIQVLQDMVGGEDQLGSTAFANLEAFIGLQVAEEDFTAARDLLSAFQQDMTDGSLDDPILLAVNGNTVPAQDDVEEFRTSILEAAPVGVAIGANTEPATDDVDLWRLGQAGVETFAPFGADTDPAMADVLGFGADLARLPPFGIKVKPIFEGGNVGALIGIPGRASGGPVSAGQPYIVGEREAELFVPDRDGQILNLDPPV